MEIPNINDTEPTGYGSRRNMTLKVYECLKTATMPVSAGAIIRQLKANRLSVVSSLELLERLDRAVCSNNSTGIRLWVIKQ